MYDFYMGSVLMPVTPSAFDMQINGKNETVELINEKEINVLRVAGLTTCRFSLLLPAQEYPFANYLSGFQPPRYYLDYFESLKQEKVAFQLIISRRRSGGKSLHGTNIRMVLEDYRIKENAKQLGFDIQVDINLKQYQSQETKVFSVSLPSENAPILVQDTRENDYSYNDLVAQKRALQGGGGGGSGDEDYSYRETPAVERTYKVQIPGMGVVTVRATSPSAAITKAAGKNWKGTIYVDGVAYNGETGKRADGKAESGTGEQSVTQALRNVLTSSTNMITAGEQVLDTLAGGSVTALTAQTRRDSDVTLTELPPKKNTSANGKMMLLN